MAISCHTREAVHAFSWQWFFRGRLPGLSPALTILTITWLGSLTHTLQPTDNLLSPIYMYYFFFLFFLLFFFFLLFLWYCGGNHNTRRKLGLGIDTIFMIPLNFYSHACDLIWIDSDFDSIWFNIDYFGCSISVTVHGKFSRGKTFLN